MAKKTGTLTYHLSPAEAALINVMRRMRNGFLEGVGVKNGEPIVIKAAMQRIDLERPIELEAALGLGKWPDPVPVNLDPDHEVAETMVATSGQ